jgi:hypothetical protein
MISLKICDEDVVMVKKRIVFVAVCAFIIPLRILD